MTAKQLVTCTLVVLVVGAWCAWAGQRSPRPGSKATVYHVTPWPDNRADTPYGALVEQHLNDLAAKGWRLSTHLESQGAKMLVFERLEGGR